MTKQDRISELRRQMQISLRAGRMDEYMSLQADLFILLNPKNAQG